MGKVVPARRATQKALDLADSVSRDEYKSVKHMNKVDLVLYLRRVWERGYEVGHEDGLRDAQAAFNAKGIAEHTATEKVSSGQE